jgi:hypothetical protein
VVALNSWGNQFLAPRIQGDHELPFLPESLGNANRCTYRCRVILSEAKNLAQELAGRGNGDSSLPSE